MVNIIRKIFWDIIRIDINTLIYIMYIYVNFVASNQTYVVFTGHLLHVWSFHCSLSHNDDKIKVFQIDLESFSIYIFKYRRIIQPYIDFSTCHFCSLRICLLYYENLTTLYTNNVFAWQCKLCNDGPKFINTLFVFYLTPNRTELE